MKPSAFVAQIVQVKQVKHLKQLAVSFYTGLGCNGQSSAG